MSIKKLPTLKNFELPDGLDRGVNGERLRDWMPDLELVNLASDGKVVIDIFDEIGGDDFFGGFTARALASLLRSAKDVIVNINSPGGSYIEGVAMYNMLVQHEGEVIVNVLGQASSAAAIIAMAGDKLNMAPAAVLFIHNVHADIYADRNGWLPSPFSDSPVSYYFALQSIRAAFWLSPPPAGAGWHRHC